MQSPGDSRLRKQKLKRSRAVQRVNEILFKKPEPKKKGSGNVMAGPSDATKFLENAIEKKIIHPIYDAKVIERLKKDIGDFVIEKTSPEEKTEQEPEGPQEEKSQQELPIKKQLKVSRTLTSNERNKWLTALQQFQDGEIEYKELPKKLRYNLSLYKLGPSAKKSGQPIYNLQPSQLIDELTIMSGTSATSEDIIQGLNIPRPKPTIKRQQTLTQINISQSSIINNFLKNENPTPEDFIKVLDARDSLIKNNIISKNSDIIRRIYEHTDKALDNDDISDQLNDDELKNVMSRYSIKAAESVQSKLIFDKPQSSSIKNSYYIAQGIIEPNQSMQPQQTEQKEESPGLVEPESKPTSSVFTQTVFDLNNNMGGGVNAGRKVESIATQTDNLQQKRYTDYNLMLASIADAEAMNKELYYGVNPYGVNTDAMQTQKLENELIERENRQNREEFEEAKHDIETLTGKNNDTLFNANDIHRTIRDEMRDNNGRSAVERGMQTEGRDELDYNDIHLEQRTANSGTLQTAILRNTTNNTFGGWITPDNIVNSNNAASMSEDMNQLLNLLGDNHIYGDASNLGDNNDLYEAYNWAERMNQYLEFGQRATQFSDVNSIYGPPSGPPPGPPSGPPPSANGGGGGGGIAGAGGGVGMQPPPAQQGMSQVQGPSLSSLAQLRQQQQQQQHRQANRRTPHDSIGFIKLGKRTDYLIDNEFEP